MKTNFNSHDIYSLVLELKEWIGYRVSNVYDINSKTICIKFNSLDSKKKYLLIESGSKFYPIDNFNSIKDFPSSFSSKLRKHLNNKRLESIRQINQDRVIDLVFGSDTFAHHIIAEFYASGNIILTDHETNIMALIHTYTDKQMPLYKIFVGNKYPFELATQQIILSLEYIKQIFSDGLLNVDKKIKLKQFVSKLSIIHYSSNVIEHCFKSLNIDLAMKINNQTNLNDIFDSDTTIEKFISLINDTFNIAKPIGIICNGCVYPWLYLNINDFLENITKFDTFSEALTHYYQTNNPIETKETIKIKEKEEKMSKQDKMISNMEQQVIGFENKIFQIHNKIDTIANYSDQIDLIIKQIQKRNLDNTIYNCIGLIKVEKIIWEKKQVEIKIEDNNFLFDFNSSIWQNQNSFYDKIRHCQDKLAKANEIMIETKKKLAKSNKIEAIKLVETELNKKHICIKGQNKENWFEQYNWFFSSDGLLFISGKTADQNEQIVKKHMEPSDIYIHSEVFGSGSGVIKNPTHINISEKCPKTLIEAGTFLISHTKSWKLGVPDNAYWVLPSQVSKTPESGEYLTKGSFIIRGNKNLIKIDKLELGLGILFKLSNSDKFIDQVKLDTQIDYAIPMLGPYTSILDSKFKIKITPGNQKIKKVLSEVINMFNKKANLIEKNAMKKITNDSFQKVLIANLKFYI